MDTKHRPATDLQRSPAAPRAEEPSPLPASETQGQRENRQPLPYAPQGEDLLESLTTVWQQHSDRIEQIARHHDLSSLRLAPRPLVFSSRRRRVLSSVAVALLCLATLACMVVLRRHFLSDTLDLLFFLLLCLALAFTAVQHLARAHSFRRQSPPAETPRPLAVSPLRYSVPRAAALAAVAVLLLFVAVPVPSGRSMSHTSLSQRSAAITDVSYVLSHLS